MIRVPCLDLGGITYVFGKAPRRGLPAFASFGFGFGSGCAGLGCAGSSFAELGGLAWPGLGLPWVSRWAGLDWADLKPRVPRSRLVQAS